MPVSIYPLDEPTTDIRDLQRMSATRPIEPDENAAGAPVPCTTVSCRYDRTCG